MFYSIVHHTDHHYEGSVYESLLEARMMPRTDGPQRCLAFDLSTTPRANVLHYQDYLGNTVHHFDLPRRHDHLRITARAVVEATDDYPDIPVLDPEVWREIDHLVAEGDVWEMVMPSHFVQPTPTLLDLAKKLDAARRADPYTVLSEINTRLHKLIPSAVPNPKGPAPIDEVLARKKGSGQELAHVMLALVRNLGIPARYVSGYFLWGSEDEKFVDHGALHSWVEALLPGWGWIGFDPANHLLARNRHVRVAYGRDYADVPPTRGIFKHEGEGEPKDSVSVKVRVKELTEGPKHAFALPAESEA